MKNTRWDSLNKDLNDINWDNLLDYQEPETAWSNFKKTLFEQINNHVPKFTIKSEFQPPWFDSECYSKCKEKDKLHKIYKKKKTLASEIRFKTARRDFKSLIKSKMRANLDTENRNMLTKKFWSHIKTTNKSTRIPEVVSCGAIATSNPTTKANLFNDYFRKQFSEPSSPVLKSWGFEDLVQVKYKIFRCSLYLSIVNTEHNKTVIYHLLISEILGYIQLMAFLWLLA